MSLRCPPPGPAALGGLPRLRLGRRTLWRVFQRRRSQPWFFASLDPDGAQSSGRFDLIAPDRAFYLATSKAAAVLEALRDFGTGLWPNICTPRPTPTTPTGASAPRAGIALDSDGEHWWLREPFPTLAEDELRAVGFAKAMLQRLAGPLAEHARRVLDGVLPGVAAVSGRPVPVRYRAAAADYQRFDAAMRDRRPVHVTYFSLNCGRERTYDLVPVE